jgi:hypothetical protein
MQASVAGRMQHFASLAVSGTSGLFPFLLRPVALFEIAKRACAMQPGA